MENYKPVIIESRSEPKVENHREVIEKTWKDPQTVVSITTTGNQQEFMIMESQTLIGVSVHGSRDGLGKWTFKRMDNTDD